MLENKEERVRQLQNQVEQHQNSNKSLVSQKENLQQQVTALSGEKAHLQLLLDMEKRLATHTIPLQISLPN